MSDLIKIEDKEGELRVSSTILSEELGVEHRATFQIIKKYQKRLEKYGRVSFEMIPFETAGGLQNTNVCYLNERQSIFLVTLSKNSEKAVDLKQKLTDSYHFYKSKKEEEETKLIPAPPKTFPEALRQLADEVEKNQLLETKITEDKPLVDFAKNIESSPEAIEVGDFANILCKKGFEIGRNRLFKLMKDKAGLKMLIDAQKPYQTALNSGWLEVEEFPYIDKSEEKKEWIAKKVMIIGKGQLYIEKKLKELQGK